MKLESGDIVTPSKNLTMDGDSRTSFTKGVRYELHGGDSRLWTVDDMGDVHELGCWQHHFRKVSK